MTAVGNHNNYNKTQMKVFFFDKHHLTTREKYLVIERKKRNKSNGEILSIPAVGLIEVI